jgi:uncharacterized protein (DUF305 family)
VLKRITHTVALPTALAATLVLAACGTADTSGKTALKPGAAATSSAPAASGANDADVEFATMMIPHHDQAISMADLALKHATDPAVKALAPNIKAAQGPEVTLMSGWLTGWSEPVPGKNAESDRSGMEGMGDQSGGMMSAKEMTTLGKATGPTFDRMWLTMMIRHHEGAVVMAKTDLAKGKSPETRKLATAIIDGQSAEISDMRSILSKSAD